MLTTSHYTINLRISAAIPLASAPTYGRFPRFHHGCTALQPTWRFLHRTHEMLVYCRLIIPEALRHGGDGWLEYDRTFWCQAAVDPSLPWHSLVPGLQAATILNARPSGGAVLHDLLQARSLSRSVCPFSCPASRVLGLLQRARVNICLSWNQGRCSFPRSCSYRHVCSVCRRDHRAIDCPDAPLGLAPQSVQLGPTCQSPLGRI